MEFPFNCEELFKTDHNGVAIADSKFLKQNKYPPNVMAIIDKLGELSAKVLSLLSHNNSKPLLPPAPSSLHLTTEYTYSPIKILSSACSKWAPKHSLLETTLGKSMKSPLFAALTFMFMRLFRGLASEKYLH